MQIYWYDNLWVKQRGKSRVVMILRPGLPPDLSDAARFVQYLLSEGHYPPPELLACLEVGAALLYHRLLLARGKAFRLLQLLYQNLLDVLDELTYPIFLSDGKSHAGEGWASAHARKPFGKHLLRPARRAPVSRLPLRI